MAWTVPNGCAYASVYPNWTTWTAGQSVPDSVAPNTMNYTGAGTGFVLVDFTNGYIYSTVSGLTLTISGSTFTISGNGGYTNDVYIIASDRALSYRFLTLAGDAFTFGDGSNIRDKFTNSGWEYTLTYGFYGRDDITSVTIPNGIGHPNDLMYTFTGCTNLQAVNGTLTQLSNATAAFSGCSALTTLPTLPLNSTASFASAFYGCASLTTAPTIPNGVTNIANCFNRCSSLTTVPTLPSTITAMQGAFMYCTALTTAPTIPSAVTNMQQCFNGCTLLTTASTVPASVTNTKWCFYDCAELTGPITIDASPTDITGMFTGTVKEIVVFGTGGLNETLVSEYANLFFWSLTATITAHREEQTPTTVDIPVNVSRFSSGTLSSLNLYRDSNPTPLSVTWNDPTLTITGTSATFTTTLTSIGESDTFTLTVVATDSYGSSQANSVKIPISFYTMDVQAGGKEIAFGGLADDDISDVNGKDYTTEGLFKCKMGTNFNDMTSQEVDDFVDNLNVASVLDCVDYVVEQDTSGNWEYRKWNSGIAEAWRYEQKNTSVGANGYLNYTVYLPSLFINEKPIVQTTGGVNGHVRGFAGYASVGGSSGAYNIDSYVVNFDGSAGTGSWLNFYVRGRWK